MWLAYVRVWVCVFHVSNDSLVSDWILWEDSNDVHLDIFLLQVCLVAVSNEPEAQNRQEDKEKMANFVSLVPWTDLTWVSLIAQIINSAMKPMTIAIDMELLEITELIQRVMLEIVHDDLIVLWGLWLVLETILGDQTGRLKWNEFAGIHRRMNFLTIVAVIHWRGHACTLSIQKHHTLHFASHKAHRQHFFFRFYINKNIYIYYNKRNVLLYLLLIINFI